MARPRTLLSAVVGSLALALLLPLQARAFTFEFNNTLSATCDKVQVKWTGGEPPFRLLIVPAYDYPSDIELDTEATWDNDTKTGEYTYTNNYPSGRRYVAVMSDVNGLATGGVSSIMTVAQNGSDSSCALRSPFSDGYFYLDPQSGQTNQCGSLGIGWVNTTNPLTILGVIPNGQAFILPNDGTDSTFFKWHQNIASGTTYILTMLDKGPNGNAGTSDFLTVGPSDDSSCISPASPSQTPGSTWGMSDGKAATTASSVPTDGGSKLSTGGIAGVVIGGILVLAAIQVTLLWFFCRTRFRRTLATSPVDLFTNKHEGEEVGGAVTHNGRDFFGRRQRDVSVFLPDPYQAPNGTENEDADTSSGALLRSHRINSGASDPFDDQGAYLHAGSVRRGSDNSSPGGQMPTSPSEGMALRDFHTTSYPPSPSNPNQHLLASPGYSTNSPGYSPASSTFAQQQRQAEMDNPNSPITAGGTLMSGQSHGSLYPTPSVVRQTKAMLALQNPDDDMEPPEGQPPRPGPSYRRHEGAGPMEMDGPRPARPGEQIDLPPLYTDVRR